jgi:hypothetical protein
MAAAAYTTDLVDIIAEMGSSTGWSLISTGGGGASSFSVPETDDFVQGANCISRNPWTSASTRGMVYSSAETVAAGDAVFFWVKADVAQALDTKANGGIQLCIGNSTSALKLYYIDGSDTYAFGGWRCVPIDPTVAQSALLGAPSAVTSFFGARWSVPVSGPSKGFPYKLDAIRKGRTLQAVSGDLGNGYATFLAAATFQGDLTRQWGLLQLQNGFYLSQGLLLLGTAATAVDFRDEGRTVFIAATDFAPSAFNTFEVRNAASRVDWTGISFKALGTVSKGRLITTDNATINIGGCTFTNMGTFGFLSALVATSTVWTGCGQITNAGGKMLDCSVIGYSGVANTSALVWNVATDTNTRLNGTVFTAPATLTHAIELGLSSPLAITLTDVGFVGYSASNNVNDSAIHVKRTTGTVTITISGGTVPSYRTDGATVVISSGATVTFTGLPTGTDVVILTAGTGTVLDQVDAHPSTSYAWAYSGTPLVDVGFIKPGKQIFYLRNLQLASSNSSIPVTLQNDRSYT